MPLTREDLEVLGRLTDGGAARVLGRLERVLEEQRMIVLRLDLILERLTRTRVDIARLADAVPARAADRPSPAGSAPGRRRRGA